MNLKPFFIAFVLCPHMLFSQGKAPLRFEQIGGLSQNTVYSILQDKQGFLWIATANGLNRYDGAEMKVYKPSLEYKKGQMKGRIVRSAMIEDNQEQIWFATDLSVNCFHKKQQYFSTEKLFFSVKPGNAEAKGNKEIFSNPLLRNGDIMWFASALEGLFALNTVTGSCTNYTVNFREENGNRVLLMYNGVYDQKKGFWFASSSGILYFNIETKQWSRYLEREVFFTICFSRDSLFLGNEKNFKWFDTRSHRTGIIPKTGEPSFSRPGMIRKLISDRDNNLWAGDQQGNIYYRQKDKNEFEWRGNINGNSVNRTNYPVYCLYADTTGILWIGADVLGLLKADIKPAAFNSYPGLSENGTERSLFIHSIYEENDKIWLGTFQNGIHIVNRITRQADTLHFPYFDPSLPYARSVPLIACDSVGNLWTSYSGYVYIRDKGQEKFKAVKLPVPPNTLQSPQLWYVMDYKGGWLLSTNVGLYTVEKKNGNYIISFLQKLGTSKLIKTWLSPDGKIWIIPETGGIQIHKNLEDLVHPEYLFPAANIKSTLYEPAYHLVWIAGSNGLIAYHLPDGRYETYTEKDGMQSDYVYAVIRCKDELWISTNNGLSRGKIKFIKGSIFPQITFTNFSINEGLPVNEFNTGAFYKGESGNLYFGSTKAAVWFKPGDINLQNNSPKLQLIGLLVNEQPADTVLAPEYISSVKLSYNNNNLFFRFRAIDFDHASKIRYKYTLEGWDKQWIYSDKLNEVRYNNLPPGTYFFRVMASVNSGIWTTDARSVQLIIAPPFWRTWWFYLMAGLAAISMVVLITRMISQQKLRKKIQELQRQRAIDMERARISREMHDDIGSGLTQITLMSEVAKIKTQQKHDAIVQIEEIAETSRRLVSNMSEIIWSLNPENKNIEQLFSYLREQLSKLLEYSDIEFEIQFPEAPPSIILNNAQRRNILLISKEITHNAIKHSGAKRIMVRATINNDWIEFTISDDGVGFDADREFSGNGLRNISKRVQELGGQLKISSAETKGTTYIFGFPLK